MGPKMSGVPTGTVTGIDRKSTVIKTEIILIRVYYDL